MSAQSSPPRGKRGPYAKSKRTQQAILDAALNVFAQGGFRSGSLREVADRVGMSEAGLLHHFPSKIDLLEAVLTRRDDISRSLFLVDESDGRSVLRSFVQIARYNMGEPGVVELYCTLSAEATSVDHPAHEYFQRRYRYVGAVAGDAMARVHASGGLVPGVEPASAARQLVALMDGLQIQWLLDRSALDMAAEVTVYLNRILIEPVSLADEDAIVAVAAPHHAEA